MGSNDELFWLWAARMPDSSVFYARHDQFAASKARQMLAIEPVWMIEALGLVQIDPASVIEGPFADGGDRIKLRTTLVTGGGQYTRLLILHKTYAWVLEQHVYDERGQLVASARNSGHEYYTIDGVSLPKRVAVEMPQSMLKLQLDVDRWSINQPRERRRDSLRAAANAACQPRLCRYGRPEFCTTGRRNSNPVNSGDAPSRSRKRRSRSVAALPPGGEYSSTHLLTYSPTHPLTYSPLTSSTSFWQTGRNARS